jgi:hypothetical protein
MALLCRIAEPKDAARIAEIHMAAFGSNKMLLAMFPSAVVRQAVQHIIKLKALSNIQDPNTTVLTVQRSATGTSHDEERPNDNTIVQLEDSTIIAFAKWAHPTESDNGSLEPQWTWPEGTALDVLSDWGKLMEEAQAAAIGPHSCYRTSLKRNNLNNNAMSSFPS